MLAHAMSSTMPTTVISSAEICTRMFGPWPAGLSRASSSDTAVALRPLLSVGYSVASRPKMVFRFARACSSETPGFSRPNARRNRPRRAS